MANLGRSHHRRWRGVALGGHLQRGCRFCLASQGGEATTRQIAEWCRPEIVYAGGKPTAIQIAKHARALRSIGARKVRRGGGNGRAVSDNRTGKQTTSLSRRWHGDLVSGSASKVETMESTD